VFAGYGKSVEVVFPQPVPRPTVGFWSAYHDADLVSVTPVAEVDSYSPWNADSPPAPPRRAAGVFFGGGKDSMLTACLLSALSGAGNLLLCRLVHPFRQGRAEMDRLTDCQERVM
jgi:hypothetical protein